MKYKTSFIAGATLLAVIIAQAELPKTIKTRDGEVYKGVSLIRVEPDGYLVSYEPTPNGVGIAKIKFTRLSRDLQRKGDYSLSESRDFESAVADANLEHAKKLVEWSDTAKATKEASQISPEESARRVKAANDLACQPPEQNVTAPATASGFSSWGTSMSSGNTSLLHYSQNTMSGNTDPVSLNSFTQPPQAASRRTGK